MESLKLEFVIDEESLMVPVKSAASVAINNIVRKLVDEKIRAYIGPIEKAVDIYLAKRLTDEKITELINNEVKTQIGDRIRELSE